MTFAQQYPRPFTKKGIGELNPDDCGVYGISRDNTWIYIGAGELRTRLLAHLDGDNDCILLQGPTHYMCEVRGLTSAESRARELVADLSPICVSAT